MSELSRFARFAVCFTFAMFLVLLFGIALFEEALASIAFLGLSWGQVLVIAIHTVPVGFAWAYVRQRSGEAS